MTKACVWWHGVGCDICPCHQGMSFPVLAFFKLTMSAIGQVSSILNSNRLILTSSTKNGTCVGHKLGHKYFTPLVEPEVKRSGHQFFMISLFSWLWLVRSQITFSLIGLCFRLLQSHPLVHRVYVGLKRQFGWSQRYHMAIKREIKWKWSTINTIIAQQFCMS